MEIDRIIGEINPKYKAEPEGKGAVFENKLVYDSNVETLEPVYFWLLDFIQTLGLEVEKLADNFVASPGSGYFTEVESRATRMREEGMKILGSVNTVIRSIINLIYDLKEFEIRFKDYENSANKDPKIKEAGISSLKQRWLTFVDVKRGIGGIDSMTHQYGFTTLRDAFMVAKSIKDVDKMDLNDRVKRILKPRIAEFLEWEKRSESELKKRYNIEKNYLKSQTNALKLYSSWVKPYLKTAEQLRMKEAGAKMPALVSAFNTMVLELCLFGKKEINAEEAAREKDIPEKFLKIIPKLRKYYQCIFIDFVFRGIPRRVSPQSPHYAHGGRVDLSFKSYVLNEDEIALLGKKLEQDDMHELLRVAEGITEESLTTIQEDIDHFLKGDKEEKEDKTSATFLNPFTPLISPILNLFRKKVIAKEKEPGKKKIEEIEKRGIKKERYEETVIRAYAEGKTKELCENIYTVYKKSHDMAAV